MKSPWLQHGILRTAALLAPPGQRELWLREWHSELWYIPRSGSTRFCLGAFRDALWLRRNHPRPAPPERIIHLVSPLSCLALLAAFATVGLAIATHIQGPAGGPWPAHLRVRDLPGGCFAMLLLFCLSLPATRMAMGQPTADRRPSDWRSRLRRGMFLAAKIVLVQPVLLGAFVIALAVGPTVPVAPQLALSVSWIAACRWVLADQRRRCPVCLRRLTEPVRIGSASQTFLEWYGAESTCSRGHGLLHTPEISTSYSGQHQWLKLDSSWSGIF